MEIINVIVIKEGIVYSCEAFIAKKKADIPLTNEAAEQSFTNKILEYGAEEENIDDHIEDGYYAGGNFSICLVHPEIQD